MRWHVKLCYWATCAEAATAIRTEVFVREQGVDPALEMDGLDPDCWHVIVCSDDGTPVGTGRLLPDGRIGRLAVRSEFRGAGIGSAMLTKLVDAAKTRGDRRIHLHAQTHAAGLYARHGFVPIGDCFMEAGIEHIEMELPQPGSE